MEKRPHNIPFNPSAETKCEECNKSRLLRAKHNAPVKLFCPHPPGTLGDIIFWGVASVLLSLYFYLAPPSLITLMNLFPSAPPFFIIRIFLWTQGCSKGTGVRTIWLAHTHNADKKYIVCSNVTLNRSILDEDVILKLESTIILEIVCTFYSICRPRIMRWLVVTIYC